jgi:uncharacterized membrane protein YphA (DoxX/SURF4 family)
MCNQEQDRSNTMKTRDILYWIFTVLFAGLITLASIPDVLKADEAIAVFHRLGYPTYLLPFLGVAKLFGVIAILIPRLDRIKEWAYAGLVFDLLGALYSHISVGDPPGVWIFALIGLSLAGASYIFRYRPVCMESRVAV